MTRRHADVRHLRAARGPAGLGLILLVLVACSDHGPVAVIDGPHQAPDLALMASAHAMGGAAGGQILMLDACDPDSFNAVLGPGACTPVNATSGIPFGTFIALLEKNQRVNAWRFAPQVIRVPRTREFRVVNAGGIPHNFVEVEEFGPGLVPPLNDLSGNPGDPVPECLDAALVPPGGDAHVTIEAGAEKKYMCCIHPWMRAESR